MTSQPRTYALAPARARSGEDPLLAFLNAARGSDVHLSVREVTRLDAQRLQTLLVAERQWLADGRGFVLSDMADAFRAGLERLGLAPDHFDKDAPR
ncbi:STAS domain-containing protein [Aestuariicoccus sp. MJ-SS9]|uniref:STAS domain-containing protein n=1 Tax=Aestuariicoccus sp. MJ-SS9 TaxID=3079855 RepID=UPI00291515FE|nr:STAS domain-containing protein [Aestuariicoccus sp. MJ-SS9]MDU8912379.1 STAS domain-containing protein [Aestuariicoccus sp. MJ-SS9]